MSSKQPKQRAPVKLTPKAIEQIKITAEEEGMPPGAGLRIAAVGPGGSKGYRFALEFEVEAAPGDVEYEQEGLAMYLDPNSATLLEGTTMDWVETSVARGFKFTNPSFPNLKD